MITIIVLFILTVVTIKIINGEGMIGHAIEAKLRTELSSYQEALKIFKADKGAANNGFYEESLTAGQNSLFYNTKPENENGDIKTVIPNLANAYLNTLEIIKGELLLTTQDKHLIKVAKELGIEVNPYIILDGELMSNDGNLLLVDENGVLTVPETVTKIGEGAFSNVEGLKKIIIPGTVKEIAKNAFKGNTTLEEVVMQEGVIKIGEGAFYNCSKLQKIDFPESITSIGSEAFRACLKLDNVVLPPNITGVGGTTFYDCSNLQNIILPSNLKYISSYCFGQCTNLAKIEIPSSVNTIHDMAFVGCSKLTEIILENNSAYQYENGFNVEKDYKKALAWYIKASSQGNASASYKIAEFYSKGLGVVKNDETAEIWYKKAVQQGYPEWRIKNLKNNKTEQRQSNDRVENSLFSQRMKSVVKMLEKYKK